MNRLLSLLMGVFMVTSHAAGDDAKAKKRGFEILCEDGKPLIESAQIMVYDTNRHSMVLALGTREKVAKYFNDKGGLQVGFGAAVDGTVIYRGVLTTLVSSKSSDQVVILVDGVAPTAGRKDSELRLELGYPSPTFFKGTDPRADRRILDALKLGGKLW